MKNNPTYSMKYIVHLLVMALLLLPLQAQAMVSTDLPTLDLTQSLPGYIHSIHYRTHPGMALLHSLE